VLEALEQFLPIADGAVAKELCRHFKKQGLDIKAGREGAGVRPRPGGCGRRRIHRCPVMANISFQSRQAGGSRFRGGKPVSRKGAAARGPEATVALGSAAHSSGRRAIMQNLGANVKVGGRSAEREARGPMLAHKGKEEGVMVRRPHRRPFPASRTTRSFPPAIRHRSGDRPGVGTDGKNKRPRPEAGPRYKGGHFPFRRRVGRGGRWTARQGLPRFRVRLDREEVLAAPRDRGRWRRA